MVYFTASILILALLLFFPVSRLIWVLSVRYLQRKMGRKLSDAELKGQFRRARVISVFITLVFSYLFTLNLIGIPTNG